MTNSTVSYKLIDSNNVPASYAKYLTWCILFISLGYHYKLIFCGGLGQVLGFNSICYTMVHGVSTNHWFEHIIYVPLIWIVLNAVNNIVFGPYENEVLSKKQRQKKWIGQFLCALFIYGHGIHTTNLLEMFARAEGLATGVLYEQIWWLDEEVSHFVQFTSFCLLISFFITQDRLDRQHGSYIAIVTGIIHGVDRGVGVIEGDHPHLGFFFASSIGLACWYRWRRHDQQFTRVWKDFFFRHGLGFVGTILIFLLSYQLFFGLSIQPSTMGTGAWRVVVLALSIIGLGLLVVFGLDTLYKKR